MSKKESKDRPATIEQRQILASSFFADDIDKDFDQALMLATGVATCVWSLAHFTPFSASFQKDDCRYSVLLGVSIFIVEFLVFYFLTKIKPFQASRRLQSNKERFKLIFSPDLSGKGLEKIRAELMQDHDTRVYKCAYPIGFMMAPILWSDHKYEAYSLVGGAAVFMPLFFHYADSNKNSLQQTTIKNYREVLKSLRNSALNNLSIEIKKKNNNNQLSPLVIQFRKEKIKLTAEGESVKINRSLLINVVSDLLHQIYSQCFIETSVTAIEVGSLPFLGEGEPRKFDEELTRILLQYLQLKKGLRPHYDSLTRLVSIFTNQHWNLCYDWNGPGHLLSAQLRLITVELEQEEIDSVLELITKSGYQAKFLEEGVICVSITTETPRQFSIDLSKLHAESYHSEVKETAEVKVTPPEQPETESIPEVQQSGHRFLQPKALIRLLRQDMQSRNSRFTPRLMGEFGPSKSEVFDFGDDGQYSSDMGDSKDLGAIRRLFQNGEPTCFFIKVTETGIAALLKSGSESERILIELNKAALVPRQHEHQQNGFVWPREQFKNGSAITMKLEMIGYAKRLYSTQEPQTFRQADGTDATLIRFDHHRDIHSLTIQLGKVQKKPVSTLSSGK